MAIAREGFQHIVELEQMLAEEFGAENYAMVRDVLGRLESVVDEVDDLRR